MSTSRSPQLNVFAKSSTDPAEPFRLLAESIPQLVWTALPDGRFDYTNQRWVDYTGLSTDDSRGWAWKEALHPDDFARYFDEWTTSIDKATSYEVEVRFRKLDGTYRWFLVRAEPLFDQERRLLGWFGTCTDVHEQRTKQELALERYRRLVEAAHEGIWEISIDGTTQLVNDRMASMLGYTAEEMAGRSVFDFIFEEDQPAAREHLRKRKEGQRLTFDWRWRRRDGSELWTLASCAPLRDSDGDVTGAVGVFADITERKVCEENLRISEERFRAFTDNMLDSMAICKAVRDESGHIVDFRIEYLNRAACEINRMSFDEQVGKGLLELLPAHRETGLFDAYCQLVDTGEPLSREMQFYEDDFSGQQLGRWFDIRASKFGDGFVATWRDVTDRKETEGALRERIDHLQTVVNATPFPAIIYNDGGGILTVNAAWSRLSGYSADELPDIDTWTRLAYRDRHTEMKGLIETTNYKMESAASRGEFTITTANGGHRVWDFYTSPLGKDERGRRLILSTAADVTDRKRIEDALRESTDRFQTLADNMSQLAWMTDPSGHIFWYNKRWHEYTGTTFEEMEGWGWQKVHHPDHVDEAVSTLKHALATGDPWTATFPLRGADGKYRWFLTHAIPVRDEDGKIVHWFGTNTDITQQFEAQDFLRRVLDNLFAFVGVLDTDGTLLQANKAPLAAADLPLEDVVGKKFWDCYWWSYDPDIQAQVRDAIERAREGEVIRYDVPVRVAGDARLWIDFQLAPLYDAEGQITHLIPSGMDLTVRHETEQALRESEERFRELANAMPQLVWTANEKGFVEYFNTRLSKYKGIAEGPDGMWAWHDLIHPQDLPGTLVAWEAVVASGHSYELEHRFQMADGTYRWHLTRAYRSSRLGKIRWFGTCTDIHDLKEAQEVMRQSEATLNTVLESLPVAVVLADANGHIFRDNAANRELWGIPPETNSWEDYGEWVGWWPETGERIQPHQWAMTRALLYGEVTHGELIQNQKFDCEERRYFLNNVTPIRDDQGQLIGGVAAMLDVTERLAAEQALRDSEERFRGTFENAAVGIAHVAPDGSWLRVNPRLCEILGYSEQEFLAKTFQDITHPDDLDADVHRFEALLRGEKDSYQMEKRYFHKDGHVVWIHLTAAIQRDHEGHPQYRISVVQDISKRKRLEDKLRQAAAELTEANRRKDEFLATLAHELRNPLAPIRTGLDVMKLAIGDPTKVEEIRQMMERQTQQLVTLVNDLLDVSRITRGKFELRKTRVAVQDVIRDAVEACRPFIDEANHKLTVTPPEHPIVVEGDPNRLVQVVSNLLSNAAKYTPKGGSIFLHADLDGKDVVLSVRDTGIGIPTDMLERVFEMFAQINRPQDETYAGLGIGLTLVKSLVDMHGGTVTVESEGENRGSVFRVRLPVLAAAPSPTVEAVKPIEEPKEVTSLRVLVVDDNKPAAKLLATLIQIFGNDVRTANNGNEACAVAEQFRPNVVFMDLGMPEMDGFEAARHIRQQPWGREMVLVAVSGWGQEDDKRQTKEAGFDHHLVKPADQPDVEEVLENARRKVKGER